MKSFSPVAGESANRISAMLLKWIMSWRLVNFISISSMIQCLQLGDLLEEDVWKSTIILHAWFKSIQREKSFRKQGYLYISPFKTMGKWNLLHGRHLFIYLQLLKWYFTLSPLSLSCFLWLCYLGQLSITSSTAFASSGSIPLARFLSLCHLTA